MRDFKRIGGEILSSPLNENFRKLRNDISIANSNLVFSDKYGIMPNIGDMEALITNPEVELTEGQVCYVVSSGELYRYSELDGKWHKIADFGQTFRQAFLNSGVVLVEEPIGVSTDYLVMPRMLVYFKNKPGEDPYLKGMYLIEKQNFNVHPGSLDRNTMYSVYVDYTKTYHLVAGLPAEDDPDNVFIGSFMLHVSGSSRQLVPELVYTMPDIAYTADRGSFLINGGQCSGAELYVAENTSVLARKSGYYYDEGINYPGESYYSYSFNQLENTNYTIVIDGEKIGYFSVTTPTQVVGELIYRFSKPDNIIVKQNGLTVAVYPVSSGFSGDELNFTLQLSIDNYPESLDDTSNYNLKELEPIGTITNLYYTTPKLSLDNLEMRTAGTIIYDKYMPKDSSELQNVGVGCYTIQKHLITPSGQNIMVYGDTEYESLEDAEGHLNDPVELEGDFLYAEVTRVIVQNPDEGTFDPGVHCHFYSTTRLSQVGTISPVFSDAEFKLYPFNDTTPTFLHISLDNIRNQNVNDYTLLPEAWSYTKYKFSMPTLYEYGSAGNTHTIPMTQTEAATHNTLPNNADGYIIPSKDQLDTLRGRTADIEKELWNDYHALKEDGLTPAVRYDQSVRYRLYKLENDLYNDYTDNTSLNIDGRLTTAEQAIAYIKLHKANKETTINGKALGNPANEYDPYAITLVTDDIQEAVGATNKWFTEQRVKDVDWVADAHTHIGRKGTGTESNANPHAMSTDDITVLVASDNQFVSRSDKTKLSNVPANTNQELDNIRNTKISDVQVYKINNTTHAETLLGGIKTLKINDFGANISVNGTVGTLECIGQADPTSVLYKTEYTPIADSMVGKSGYVDKALFADAIDTTGISASQYYGSDEDYPTTTVGWHDLPVYVSTGDAESYTNINSVILQPEEKSVALKHLATSRVTYTPADEESTLGDNVYNLVKNHYHKVYNSGTQGPYIEDPNHPGTYIQDTSGITYTYKVPYGGLVEHVYYLEYNNVNYSFNTTNLGTIPVNTILTYIPASGNIEVTISGTTSTLTTSQVQPTVVDETYYLEFVAQTDWSKINKWNFGNNLTVTVSDGIATINAFNASGDTPVHSFINLDDVDFVYNDAQPGQMLVINATGDGVDVSNAPALSSYMLISDYVNSTQPTKVNAAVAADTATSASTADSATLLQGMYSVNDNNTDNTSLWTSNKISTTISSKIALEGVRTDYGSELPTAHTFTFTPKKETYIF